MSTQSYCSDCPDREACHTGMPCDFVKQVDAAFRQREEALKGKVPTMSNTAKNVTPKDVAEKAEEFQKNADIPTQASDEPNAPELEVIEGELKETFRSRFHSLTEKLKRNRKAVVGATAAFAVATVAVVKFVQSQAEQVADDGDDQEIYEAAMDKIAEDLESMGDSQAAADVRKSKTKSKTV